MDWSIFAGICYVILIFIIFVLIEGLHNLGRTEKLWVPLWFIMGSWSWKSRNSRTRVVWSRLLATYVNDFYNLVYSLYTAHVWLLNITGHCPSGDDPKTSTVETNCTGVKAKDSNYEGEEGNLCQVDCANQGHCDYSTGFLSLQPIISLTKVLCFG